MGGFTKWLLGGLGWAIFGPLGALVGFVAGALLETREMDIYQRNQQQSRPNIPEPTTAGDFAISLVVLTSAVMKADGKIVKAELDYVKAYYNRYFGTETAAEVLLVLRDLLKQEIPVSDVCIQIRMNTDYATRLQLLHFLYGVAMSDGIFSKEENNLLHTIAGFFHISQADISSLKAMFVKDINWAYQVLEIPENSNDEEIKKAYRKMAVKYHPDKVSYLGEEFQKAANEKFQKVNEAYETLKKERSLN